MTRPFPRLTPLVLAASLLASPPAFAAQLQTNPLTTAELYRNARTRLERVNPQCKGSLNSYLEAAIYMYAFLQAAGRDGALKSDPGFAYTFREQFDGVLNIAERCLKAYPPASSAGMRSDGTESLAREVMPPGISLPDLPAGLGGGLIISPKSVSLEPGASQQFTARTADGRPLPNFTWRSTGGSITGSGVYTAGPVPGTYHLIIDAGQQGDTAVIVLAGGATPPTDAQGRTISQLVAIIEQFPQERANYRAEITRVEQQRDALAAELNRLRNVQPPPPPPPPNMSGEYRIQVRGNNLFWHEDGNGDRKISTRYQPNDDFTRFILELQGDGSYRIRVKASNRYLHAPGHQDWIVSTLAQVNDDYTRFYLEWEPDGRVFRLRQKATGRYLGQRGDGLLSNNVSDSGDFSRFLLWK